jgi:hypothetical protein
LGAADLTLESPLLCQMTRNKTEFRRLDNAMSTARDDGAILAIRLEFLEAPLVRQPGTRCCYPTTQLPTTNCWPSFASRYWPCLRCSCRPDAMHRAVCRLRVFCRLPRVQLPGCLPVGGNLHDSALRQR